mmetsp:Transcript_23245/g.56015  ORF Transcript_23245/g.56015 Transcript_23245/m.56015 type:complete len:89 (+) Transcript_23245:324-590(+)
MPNWSVLVAFFKLQQLNRLHNLRSGILSSELRSTEFPRSRNGLHIVCGHMGRQLYLQLNHPHAMVDTGGLASISHFTRGGGLRQLHGW